MTPLVVIVILCVGRVRTVSVDPDMSEMPLQAETEEVFVFPSMRINPLNLVRQSLAGCQYGLSDLLIRGGTEFLLAKS